MGILIKIIRIGMTIPPPPTPPAAANIFIIVIKITPVISVNPNGSSNGVNFMALYVSV